MASGQLDYSDPNRRFPDTLLFMERAMTQFLQVLFSTFPPGDQAFHYDNNPDLTEISIEGRQTDNLTNMDTRPKIVVYRGPVSWAGHSIGSLVGSKNLSQRGRTFADIYNGTVSINCFAREDLESERIANICFDAIKMFREQIQKLGFLSIHSAQCGQRGKVKADARPELYVTPVIVETQITKNWRTDKVDPVLLRHILIQLMTTPTV